MPWTEFKVRDQLPGTSNEESAGKWLRVGIGSMRVVRAEVEIGNGWILKLRKVDNEAGQLLGMGDKERLRRELLETLRRFSYRIQEQLDSNHINLR